MKPIRIIRRQLSGHAAVPTPGPMPVSPDAMRDSNGGHAVFPDNGSQNSSVLTPEKLARNLVRRP